MTVPAMKWREYPGPISPRHEGRLGSRTVMTIVPDRYGHRFVVYTNLPGANGPVKYAVANASNLADAKRKARRYVTTWALLAGLR